MRTQIRWGPTILDATYEVQGANLAEALEFLESHRRWAWFTGNFQPGFRCSTGGYVQLVSLYFDYVITMPAWPAYSHQPARCQAEWDRMWHALWKHEDHHRLIFERWVSDLERSLESHRRCTAYEAARFIASSYLLMRRRQDEFDQADSHGCSRGITLDVTGCELP
jgi:predicted secreted Zn-dependent protease